MPVLAVPVELAADNPAEGQLILSGYPGGVHDGHTLFSTPSPANRMEGEFLRYDIATYRSNSGGPVWRMRDGRAELVAIHVRSGGGGRVVNQAFRDEVARMIAVLDSRAADSRRAARQERVSRRGAEIAKDVALGAVPLCLDGHASCAAVR